MYLFNLTGHFDQKFNASDSGSGDHFGSAIASYGKVVVIGARKGYKSGVMTGTAYVFHLDTKAEVHKLNSSDGAHGDFFGTGVAIDRNRIMVSAVNNGIGAVYTFDALSGDQLQKFVNRDAPQTGFGSSCGLAIHSSTNVGIVGHNWEGRNGKMPKAGAVYVFDLSTGAQLRKITPADSAAGMFFGISLVLSGGFLVVGAQSHCSGRGSVFVFNINANWTETAFFGPSDGEIGGIFGRSVASNGQYFIVGAKNHVNGPSSSGAVYVEKTTAGAKYVFPNWVKHSAIFAADFGGCLFLF